MVGIEYSTCSGPNLKEPAARGVPCLRKSGVFVPILKIWPPESSQCAIFA